MRRAAIKAGLIRDEKEDYGRVQFVTEGEASLHYCLNNGCKSLVSCFPKVVSSLSLINIPFSPIF
jgi:hypothetical protein